MSALAPDIRQLTARMTAAPSRTWRLSWRYIGVVIKDHLGTSAFVINRLLEAGCRHLISKRQ